MTNRELALKLTELIKTERKVTNEILALINLALEQRSYLDLGFSSMFDWLVKGFGFSSSSAYRRIEAARLLKSVPDAFEKLETGKVNLSTLSKAQNIIRQQEKLSGEKLSNDTKNNVVNSIEQKTVLEAEQVLISMFPETASEINQERHKVIDENQIRHQMNLSNEAAENLRRGKEVLSHKFPNATDAEIVTFALEILLNKFDPLRKAVEKEKDNFQPNYSPQKTTAAAAVKRLKFQEGQARCSYQDPVTGQKCGSAYQVQLDHIVPKALGGSSHSSNFRLLCRPHNLLMAERVFGKKIMNSYRRDG